MNDIKGLEKKYNEFDIRRKKEKKIDEALYLSVDETQSKNIRSSTEWEAWIIKSFFYKKNKISLLLLLLLLQFCLPFSLEFSKKKSDEVTN